MAPHTVAQALKTALLASRLFDNLGFETSPSSTETRADIIQAIKMQTPERLVAFCQGIQTASPVDSMAMPEPWDMPGYDDQVVMAAGTFVAGASIELSADGPIRPPYTAFMQGGLTYSHGRIALSEALRRMMEQKPLPVQRAHQWLVLLCRYCLRYSSQEEKGTAVNAVPASSCLIHLKRLLVRISWR